MKNGESRSQSRRLFSRELEGVHANCKNSNELDTERYKESNVALLLRNPQVPGSNFGPEIGCHD